MLTHAYAILCLHTYILSLSSCPPFFPLLSHTHTHTLPPRSHLTHTLTQININTHTQNSKHLYTHKTANIYTHTHTHTHSKQQKMSRSIQAEKRKETRHTPPQCFSLVTGTPDAAWCCGQREGVPVGVPSDSPHSEIIHFFQSTSL